MAGGDPSKRADDEYTQRSAVEKHFVTNAMAFFVGWCHISWIQDLSTLTAVGLGQHGWAWGAIGQVFLVFIFGPVLTVVVVAGNSALHRRFSSAARVEPAITPQRHLLTPFAEHDSADMDASAVPLPQPLSDAGAAAGEAQPIGSRV